MLCRRCLRLRALAPSILPRAPARSLSTTSPLSATPISPNTATQTAPRQGTSSSSHNPPAATSTSAAQPFSEANTPAPPPDAKAAAAAAAEKKAAPLVRSSVPAGTPLKGLNFYKDRQDPIALADEEYPAWLWTVLDRQEKGAEAAAQGDLFAKSKKQRRIAAKRLRKEQLANPEMLVPKVPIYEQTIDLPAGDGSLEGALNAAQGRGELTKAMRGKRRADIKEKNFLKAMG